MRFFRLRRPRDKAHRSNLYPVYALISLFLAMVIALGVLSIVLVRRSRQLEAGYNTLTNHIQTDLNMAIRTYDQASLPTADLSGDIVPNLRMYLYSADAFNEVLVDQYGQDTSVLDDNLYRQITLALDDIMQLVATGKSTDESVAQLDQYMATLQTNMTEKFSYSNLLLPQRAMG